MGFVTIQEYTTKKPISLIGEEAGVCWGADVTDEDKNYKRGLSCLKNEHGRTFEFPDVYMVLDGYSARVIREWYTHIGGLPTRLQASTRYIEYGDFTYVTPPSVKKNDINWDIYDETMRVIEEAIGRLEANGVPREDTALLLPLGMETKVVCKHNLRNLIDMSHQRMCSRAYHEFRELFYNIADALRNYSDEWDYIVDNYFIPKCEYLHRCPEEKSCGAYWR